jgi:hypothetical protein
MIKPRTLWQCYKSKVQSGWLPSAWTEPDKLSALENRILPQWCETYEWTGSKKSLMVKETLRIFQNRPYYDQSCSSTGSGKGPHMLIPCSLEKGVNFSGCAPTDPCSATDYSTFQGQRSGWMLRLLKFLDHWLLQWHICKQWLQSLLILILMGRFHQT